MTSFLDKIGLQRLWDAITSLFATKTEVAARTTARIYYGTCSTTASYVAKVATTETFPTVAYDDNGTTKYKPESGTVVGIKYSVSNTYKTAGSTHTLEVNSTGAWPMYYNNAELATTTSANTLVAGYKNRYVFYMFNGTQWVFLAASYDANSTYSSMTQAELDAGTSTTGRTLTPKLLRDNVYTETECNTNFATAVSYDSSSKKIQYTKNSTATDVVTLASVATSGSYNDLSNTPTIPTVPTNVSDFNNDAGYLISETDPTVPSWAKASSKPSYTASEVGAVPTTRTVNGKALSADITLSASDVSALPSSTSIPTKVSDLTNDSGFTTNAGTITGITMNNVSKGTSGVVDLGTVITSETSLLKGTTSGEGNAVTDISVSGHTITLTKGITFLTSHQDISGKQDVLTFDNSPVSGSNNPVKSGGLYTALAAKADTTALTAEASTRSSADSTLSTQISAKADKTAEVDHGTSDTTFTLTPNVFHKWGEVSSLTLTLGTGTSGEYNEYMFQFTSGSTPTTLSLPNSVIWVQPLTVQASKTYQVSIVNNLAAYITDGMAAAESSGGTPTYATESWVTSLIETSPTENSSNLATSGGTYAAIEGGYYYS